MTEKEKLLNVLYKTPHEKLLQNDDSLDIVKTTYFFFQLIKCLKSLEYQQNIQMGPVLLVLDTENVGTGLNMLSPQNMGTFLSSGTSRKCNVILIDYDGRQIVKDFGKFTIENPADACKFSSDESKNVFFIEGNRVEVFSKGKFTECIPDIFSNDRTIKIREVTRPVSEYRLVINAHYKEKIERKDILDYWKNKQKRILKPAPEKRFAGDLAYFLNQYLSDGHVDYECMNGWTSDRTDIRVLRYEDRKIYIFEVKWLGKSFTIEYKDDRADVGIVQINRYLKDEPHAVCGVLVIYDARGKDVDIQWNKEIERDTRIDEPMRFYLISESASDEAKRVVGDFKKRQKNKSN